MEPLNILYSFVLGVKMKLRLCRSRISWVPICHPWANCVIQDGIQDDHQTKNLPFCGQQLGRGEKYPFFCVGWWHVRLYTYVTEANSNFETIFTAHISTGFKKVNSISEHRMWCPPTVHLGQLLPVGADSGMWWWSSSVLIRITGDRR